MGSAKPVINLLEDLAREALVGDHGLDPEKATARLELELKDYRELDLSSHDLAAVFRQFCVSLASRAGLFNVIFGGPGSFPTVARRFERVLLGFDPKRVASKYEGKQPATQGRLTPRAAVP